MEAARIAKMRGHQVTLVEKKPIGRTAQTGRRSSRQGKNWLVLRVSDRPDEKIEDQGSTESPVSPSHVQKLKPDVVIVATGATRGYPIFRASRTRK